LVWGFITLLCRSSKQSTVLDILFQGKSVELVLVILIVTPLHFEVFGYNLEKILLGFTLLNKELIEELFSINSSIWESSSYNPFKKNCNDFSYSITKLILNDVSFPSYINRFSFIFKCLDCFYGPIKSILDSRQNSKNERQIVTTDMKDNSHLNLISKLPSNKFFNKLNSSETHGDINSDLSILKTNFDNVIHLDIIDNYHIKDLIKNFDFLILELKALSKNISNDNSSFITNITLILKKLFFTFDLLIDISKEYFKLSI
jgi:hypothetical protein